MEICVNRSWVTVCENFFDVNDAVVTCNQLGYPRLGLFVLRDRFHIHKMSVHAVYIVTEHVVIGDSSHFGSGNGHILDLDCTGSESDVLECGHLPVSSASNCTHKSDVGVICRGNCF